MCACDQVEYGVRFQGGSNRCWITSVNFAMNQGRVMFKFIYMCNYSSGQRKRDPEFPTICVLLKAVKFGMAYRSSTQKQKTSESGDKVS